MNHELYMQRCVDLALKGGLDTKSNPMVGAVLVYKDKIIGEGWHSFYGGPHAEVNAISSVKSEDQELIPLSTLYVSLEPCCVQGKTPACTSLILENKIPKVVIGSMDPDPRMQGKGLTLLREQGIEVTEKVLQHECDALLSRFKANLKKHPYIVLKWATRFDQVMGHRQERLIITGEAALWHTHKWRSECHGILIGKETAKTDNPLLNTRYYPGPSPIKIVMDRNLELDPQLRLFAEGEVIVVNEKKQETSGRVKYVKVNSTYHWPEVMEKLYENQIYSVLVEGGSKILNSLIASGWWNEARILRTQALLKNQLETQDWITAPDIAGKLIKQIDIEDGCKVIYIENKVQG
ncbi:MAG: bifunctional diaminohydroxyphosphoribosylaminopyrimidine deaminase/5-amino-6-(5-phosphoribosylamino)uracil reductase RibD [Saprospiraceae bacterium]|nr:bifunctional diaminohydroxyphosphoribosylaminopyrimidine deaminase/5-amino-6-(5-phosphoribosylamino)uracil reductase RibD [Saprospiraceae bacterium]